MSTDSEISPSEEEVIGRVDDEIGAAVSSVGGVGVAMINAEAVRFSFFLGFHTCFGCTMGQLSLNNLSLCFSTSCSSFSWVLMRWNLLLCALVRLEGHHLG